MLSSSQQQLLPHTRCLECRRKNLPCENRKPCNYCIDQGKEDSCDASKKRRASVDLGMIHTHMTRTNPQLSQSSGPTPQKRSQSFDFTATMSQIDPNDQTVNVPQFEAPNSFYFQVPHHVTENRHHFNSFDHNMSFESNTKGGSFVRNEPFIDYPISTQIPEENRFFLPERQYEQSMQTNEIPLEHIPYPPVRRHSFQYDPRVQGSIYHKNPQFEDSRYVRMPSKTVPYKEIESLLEEEEGESITMPSIWYRNLLDSNENLRVQILSLNSEINNLKIQLHQEEILCQQVEEQIFQFNNNRQMYPPCPENIPKYSRNQQPKNSYFKQSHKSNVEKYDYEEAPKQNPYTTNFNIKSENEMKRWGKQKQMNPLSQAGVFVINNEPVKKNQNYGQAMSSQKGEVYFGLPTQEQFSFPTQEKKGNNLGDNESEISPVFTPLQFNTPNFGYEDSFTLQDDNWKTNQKS